MSLTSVSEVIRPHLGSFAGIVCCDAFCRTYRHLSQLQPMPHHMYKPIAVVNSIRVLNGVLWPYVCMWWSLLSWWTAVAILARVQACDSQTWWLCAGGNMTRHLLYSPRNTFLSFSNSCLVPNVFSSSFGNSSLSLWITICSNINSQFTVQLCMSPSMKWAIFMLTVPLSQHSCQTLLWKWRSMILRKSRVSILLPQQPSVMTNNCCGTKSIYKQHYLHFDCLCGTYVWDLCAVQ